MEEARMPSRRPVVALAMALLFLAPPRSAMAQGAKGLEQAEPPDPEDDAPAVAEAPSKPGEARFGEEIVVTGSRIRRKDLTTPAPVTVLSREQLMASGKVTIGDFLQTLPEQGNATNSQVNNGGDGSTRVNLRGLGTSRTLVLVNGRRFMGTMQLPQFTETTVDLNSIPTAAVERIEILKDGASSIYGSDAIGGVVNIITRKKFEGVEASAYSGISRHRDGAVFDVNATAGTSSDRGSALLTAGFMKQNSVMAGSRRFSRSQLDLDFRTGEVKRGGSDDIPAGRFTLPVDTDGAGVVTGCQPGGTQLYQDLCAAATGTTHNQWKYDPATPLGYSPFVQGDRYNYQPANYDVTPLQRIQIFSAGDLSINSSSRAYYEASFVNRQSRQQIAPNPLDPFFFVDPAQGAISADSVYNPLGVQIDDYGRRLLEFGPRTYDQEVDTARVVVGLTGTLPDSTGPLRGWVWDANLNYGRSWGTYVTRGALRTDRLAAALGPSMIDPATGQAICVGTAGDPSTSIAGCTPIDLLHVAGPITADQQAGLGYTGTTYAMLQMFDLQASVNGELLRLAASRPAALALGYEFRREYGQSIPDPIAAAGQSTDGGWSASGGGYYANEAFGELSVPILDQAPFVRNLEAVASGRFVNYSSFGTNWTYKLGARYTPISDVTLRGTYSTAFRAPSIADLYLGPAGNSSRVVDPCSGLNPVTGETQPVHPRYAAECQAQGAAANGDESNEITTLVRGESGLRPETARTFTVGLVLEPRWVKNLTATVDYWNIAIDRSITSRGASAILNGCLSGTNPSFCGFIHRDPATGYITHIDDFITNAGDDRVDGIDIALRYALPTGFGRFGFSFDGTWLHKFDRILVDGTVVHGKGTYDLANTSGGFFGVYPAWKFNAGVSYAIGGASAAISTRFVGSYKECANVSGQSGGGACYLNPTDPATGRLLARDVAAYSVWDLALGYAFETLGGRTAIQAGVNNLFDATPPVIYNSVTPTSDPSAYDFVGRFFYARLTHHI
jgi:outer membrane receptor protein involved in Fe transport